MEGTSKVLLLVLAAVLLVVPFVTFASAATYDYEVERTLTVASGSAQSVTVKDQNQTWYVNVSANNPVNVYILAPGTSVGSSSNTTEMRSVAVKYWEGQLVILNQAFTPSTNRLGTFTIWVVNVGTSSASVTVQVDTARSSSASMFCQIGFFVCLGGCCLVVVLIVVLLILLMVKMIMGIKKKQAQMEQNWSSGQAAPQPQQPQSQPMAAQPAPGMPPQQPMQQGGQGVTLFQGNNFRVDKKIIALASQYRVYGPQNTIIGFSYMKMFTLKEDIKIFADEAMTRPLILLKQQQVLDITGTFLVQDMLNGEVLGYLKRDAISSFISTRWEIYNAQGVLVGYVTESSILMALLRRFSKMGSMIPDSLDVTMGNVKVALVQEKFRVIGNEFSIQIFEGQQRVLDRRLGVALLLLMAVYDTGR